MATIAIHEHHAWCAECDWLGPARGTHGLAVTDDRHHVHFVDAQGPLAALLLLTGNGLGYAGWLDEWRRSHPPVHVGTQRMPPRL